MKTITRISLILAVLMFLILSGCATFSVKPPPGMFLSTGDYVKDVETMGILQVSSTKFCFLFIYDINRIRTQLYKELLEKARLVNADGLTNVQFYWKLSPFTYFSMWVVSGMFDFYMEGVAIKTK